MTSIKPLNGRVQIAYFWFISGLFLVIFIFKYLARRENKENLILALV